MMTSVMRSGLNAFPTDVIIIRVAQIHCSLREIWCPYMPCATISKTRHVGWVDCALVETSVTLRGHAQIVDTYLE